MRVIASVLATFAVRNQVRALSILASHQNLLLPNLILVFSMTPIESSFFSSRSSAMKALPLAAWCAESTKISTQKTLSIGLSPSWEILRSMRLRRNTLDVWWKVARRRVSRVPKLRHRPPKRRLQNPGPIPTDPDETRVLLPIKPSHHHQSSREKSDQVRGRPSNSR